MGSARKVSSNSPGKSSASGVAPEGKSPSTEMGKGSDVKVKQEEKGGAIESPIKFYDAEVKRMHAEIEKRENAPRRRPRPPVVPSSRPAPGVTIKGFLTRVAIFYLFIAYFLVCPSDPTQSRAVCRGINNIQSTLLSYEPAVRPYYDTASRKLDPYLSKVHAKVNPYVETVRPYYHQVDNLLRPHFQNSVETYNTHVHPRILNGMVSAQEATKPLASLAHSSYQSTVAPSVEWYTNAGNEWYALNAGPRIASSKHLVSEYAGQAYEYISPLYFEGLPLIKKHYYSTVRPLALSTYQTTTTTYSTEIQPRLITGSKHTLSFYKSKVLPALQRFYSLYIAPQVDKIKQKIFEYRTEGSVKEAEQEVQKEVEEIKETLEVDDLDDFIAELRDTTYVEPVGSVVADPVKEEEVLPTPEETAALTASKRRALEALQTTYEKQIAKLGQTEHDLLITRLQSIRSTAAEDIPRRFNSILEDLDGEGDKMVGRLQKYFARAASNDKHSTEEKVKDSEFLAKKAAEKVRKLAGQASEEVEAYRRDVEEKEKKAVEKASEGMAELVTKAQEELGFGWTWLDDVRHSDWARFHKLSKAEATWTEYYAGLQSGTIDDDDLSSSDNSSAILDDVKYQITSLVESFEAILHKIKNKGQHELKGEYDGIVDGAQKVFEAATGKIAEVVEVVQESASSIIGITPTPSTGSESIKSVAAIAQESASSLASSVYKAIPTLPAVATDFVADSFNAATEQVVFAAEQAASAAGSVYAEASQTILSAAGIEPSPTDLSQSAVSLASVASSIVVNDITETLWVARTVIGSGVSSIIAEATEGVAQAASAVSSAIIPTQLSSVVSSVYSEASTLVIGTPTPSNLALSASSVAASLLSEGSISAASVTSAASSIAIEATKSIESIYAEVTSSAAAISSSVSASISSASSAVSSIAAPHPSFSKSALGIAVTAEGFASSVSSAAASISDEAASIIASVSAKIHDATRTTPEGAVEHATSVVKVVKSAVASAVHIEL